MVAEAAVVEEEEEEDIRAPYAVLLTVTPDCASLYLPGIDVTTVNLRVLCVQSEAGGHCCCTTS
jgi:hypothetical protein